MQVLDSVLYPGYILKGKYQFLWKKESINHLILTSCVFRSMPAAPEGWTWGCASPGFCYPSTANGAWLSRGALLRCPPRKKRGLWLLFWIGPRKHSVSVINISIHPHTVLTQGLVQAFFSSQPFFVGFFFSCLFVWVVFFNIIGNKSAKSINFSTFGGENSASVLRRSQPGVWKHFTHTHTHTHTQQAELPQHTCNSK